MGADANRKTLNLMWPVHKNALLQTLCAVMTLTYAQNRKPNQQDLHIVVIRVLLL